RLRIAASAAFAREHVLSWLGELRRAHPQLELELVLDSRMSDLVEERVDVAIRLGAMRPSALIATKLCDMPRVVVASPAYLSAQGHPRAPADLANHPCLAFPFEGFGPTWLFRDGRGRTSAVELKPSRVVPDGTMLRELALQGLGPTLLPRWLVAGPLHDGRLIDLFPRYDVTGTVHDAAVWLVFPSRDYLPLKVRVFIDYVKAQFRDGPAWERPIGADRAHRKGGRRARRNPTRDAVPAPAALPRQPKPPKSRK
ncbi:MAG: substrate binding domain-containing protein, partial [Myxococcota bacterium]